MLRANFKDYFPSEISISLTENKITIEIDISVHQNYVGTDIDREPFLLSVVVTDVNNHNVQQYRAILWCKSVSLYVLAIMVILIAKRKGKRSVAFMTQNKARVYRSRQVLSIHMCCQGSEYTHMLSIRIIKENEEKNKLYMKCFKKSIYFFFYSNIIHAFFHFRLH